MPLLRKGNLIVNGDFESGDTGCPPDDWTSYNAVLVGPDKAFTGCRAVSLGGDESCDPAVLYQDVEVSPRHRYELSFQIGVWEEAKGPVVVQVRWLDAFGTDLGTGLHVFIEAGHTPDISRGFWNSHVHLTDLAPARAVAARVLFTAGKTWDSCPPVIDCVAFADIC